MRHTQTWVKVNVEVDCGIAGVVAALSDIERLRTLDSCQGDSEHSASVYFDMGCRWQELGELVFGRMRELLRPHDAEVRLEPFGDTVIAHLVFPSASAAETERAIRQWKLEHENP